MSIAALTEAIPDVPELRLHAGRLTGHDVLSAAGRLTAGSAEAVRAQLAGLAGVSWPPRLILRLDNTAFIDTVALGVLVRAAVQARTAGGCLHVAGGRDLPPFLGRRARLRLLLGAAASVEEAAASCRPPASVRGLLVTDAVGP